MLDLVTSQLTFSNPLYLDSGRILTPYNQTYETYGTLNEQKDNVILICHAFSGSHHAAGIYENDSRPGWWDDFIGPNKPVNTNTHFVICINVVGSCFGSTGPISEDLRARMPYRLKFPVVTIQDMVRAQKIMLSQIGIYHVKAIIGGSMGGMQALAFGVMYPDFADIIVPMATTSATSAWVIALNKVAQNALLADPAYKNGEYDPQDIIANGMPGLAAARMAGFLGYISPEGMNEKFGRNYVANDGLYELFGRFEVERYLDYNGGSFPKRFDPLSFLYLLKAINIFDISSGFEDIPSALSRIKSKLFLISFKGDTMFFPEEMRQIHEIIQKQGMNNSRYLCIDSDYGHDAFLIEVDKFGDLIQEILEI